MLDHDSVPQASTAVSWHGFSNPASSEEEEKGLGDLHHRDSHRGGHLLHVFKMVV